MTTPFLNELSTSNTFVELIECRAFLPVPESWHLINADIENSTHAIEHGKYQSIVFSGVSLLVAVQNRCKSQIPYVFGGDGVTFCCDNEPRSVVLETLLLMQRHLAERAGQKLRIGAIQLNELYGQGLDLFLGRYRGRSGLFQFCLYGAAISHFESSIKQDQYLVTGEVSAAVPSLSGFECRWNPVSSAHGSYLCLIARPRQIESIAQIQMSNIILNELAAIYSPEQLASPLQEKDLLLSFTSEKLAIETNIRATSDSYLSRFIYLVLLYIQVCIGKLIMHFGWPAGTSNWKEYRSDFVHNPDFQKFNGDFIQMISGTSDQHDRMKQWLAHEHAAGYLFYGTHEDSNAIVACQIEDYARRHLHFVDGASGGFTIAASNLKKQIAQSQTSVQSY